MSPKLVKDRNKHLAEAFKSVDILGYVLEFGVYSGDSINNVLSRCTDGIVFGFDSFEGLPEDWHRGKDIYEAGRFAVPVPTVNDNVELVVGWFEDTLEDWKRKNLGQVRFIHIDVDLYSSAKYVLETLNDRIVPGTVIVFDELCDWENSGTYDLWKEGEWKAWHEWMEEYGRECEMFSRAQRFEAAVRVIQ